MFIRRASVTAMMIILVAAGGFLFFFCGCGNTDERTANDSSDMTEPHPCLHIEKRQLDFGRHRAGEEFARNIPFKNSGDADLVITRAMGIGSGITVDFPKEPLKPGGEDQLTIRLNTRGRSGPEERRVVIVSNDPKEPRQSVTFTVDLELNLGIQPHRVWFGNISRETPVVREFRFIGTKTPNLMVESIEFDAGDHQEMLSFSFGDLGQRNAEDLTVQVELHPQALKPGTFNIPVRIRSGIPDEPDLDVFLTGTIEGPYIAEPDRLYFRHSEQPVDQPVTIKRHDGSPFRIIRAETDLDLFSVISNSQDSVPAHTLIVRFSAGKSQELQHRANLIIETDASDYSFMEIPLFSFQKIERK